MIKFVMNAFPRTGSTILYWMFKGGYPDAVHLYEPLHDKLFRLIKEEDSVMHGGSLWDGYQAVRPDKLNKMWLLAKDCTNLYRFTDVKPYLDVVNSIENDVYLQPNRMHLILQDVAQEYGCKVAHLCRKPADCFLGLVEIFAMYAKDLTKNYDWWIENICGFISFFGNQYDFIADKFGAPHTTQFMDKWLVVYTYQNYYAAQQADGKNVMIVMFEDIVDGKGIDKLEEFGEVQLGAKDIIKPDRVFLADDAFKEEVDGRIKDLGLMSMVEEIYEIAKI